MKVVSAVEWPVVEDLSFSVAEVSADDDKLEPKIKEVELGEEDLWLLVGELRPAVGVLTATADECEAAPTEVELVRIESVELVVSSLALRVVAVMLAAGLPFVVELELRLRDVTMAGLGAVGTSASSASSACTGSGLERRRKSGDGDMQEPSH